jgi:hypothetical protein
VNILHGNFILDGFEMGANHGLTQASANVAFKFFGEVMGIVDRSICREPACELK